MEANRTEKLEQLRQILKEAKRMVFFGGAGVSTESGIPDFRSVDGLYHQKFKYPPETMLSHSFFYQHPADFFDFYRQKLNCLSVEPNLVHKKLADWEQEGWLTAVITQNIDGLHQKAGSKRVIELHGSIYRNYCDRCLAFYGPEAVFDSEEPIPKCTCGGFLKPDVVLYEEALSDKNLRDAISHLSQADVLLVAGTSLTVYPACNLIRYFKGKHLIMINRDSTGYDGMADLIFHESLGTVFSEL